MDTKINFFTGSMLVLVSISLFACGQNTTSKPTPPKADTALVLQQQMLKDYFLCTCIDDGFKEDSLFFKDATRTVYTELLEYEYDDLQKIRKVAQQLIDADKNKKGETSADTKADRAVFYTCIEYYKSSELDNLIKSMHIKK